MLDAAYRIALGTLLVLGMIGLGGCAHTTANAKAYIAPGMNAAQVRNTVGNPDVRSFRAPGDEAWQYHDVVGYGQCEYITIFLRKTPACPQGCVTGLDSRRGSSIAGCGLGSRPVDWSQMEPPQGRSASHEPARAVASSGTCFFVNSDGIALTNHHVIEGHGQLLVTDHQGIEYSAHVMKIDSANDIAVLKVDAGAATPYIPLAPLGSLRVGEEIFTLGHPVSSILGNEVKYTNGAVSALSGLNGAANMFQMTTPIQPGSSGAPVLNSSGRAVGIATSTASFYNFVKATGSLPQNVNWAIKSDYASLLLGDVVSSEKLESDARTSQEVIDAAISAVCRIEAR